MEKDNFKPHEVWVTKRGMGTLPDLMREHIEDGGSLYMMEAPENHKAFISTSEEIEGAVCAHVSMEYIRQEITLKDDAYIPSMLRDHIRNGGKVYMSGEFEDGTGMVADDPRNANIITLFTEEDIAVWPSGQDVMNDFTDAVASIAINDNGLEQ